MIIAYHIKQFTIAAQSRKENETAKGWMEMQRCTENNEKEKPKDIRDFETQK